MSKLSEVVGQSSVLRCAEKKTSPKWRGSIHCPSPKVQYLEGGGVRQKMRKKTNKTRKKTRHEKNEKKNEQKKSKEDNKTKKNISKNAKKMRKHIT